MSRRMRKLFGTDGIRGTVDVDLTTDLVADVGRALAAACRDGVLGERVDRPRIVIGRDTRPSGERLEGALITGLLRGGADAVSGGVLPTAAVAYLVHATEASAGVVVSASHNPPGDNGIKIFGPGGWKLDLEAEAAVEELVGSAPDAQPGSVVPLPDALARYVDHLVEGGRDLHGLRVVVDCANGAAFRAGPEALRRLGADVTAINADDDGRYINDGCGALHAHVVADRARESGAVGVTFDGDADRVLFSDEEGHIVDGDGTLAVVATRMRASGRLRGHALVATVMANQALRRWCADEGIELVETSVGDRHVLEMMRAKSLVLGGEQSGHVIVGDRTTTGDGILTAIELLEALAERGGRLGDIVPFRPIPQVLVNVATNGGRVSSGPRLREAIERAQRKLGAEGRILVRRSGTEPVVRVMVEAPDHDLASGVAEEVAHVLREDSS